MHRNFGTRGLRVPFVLRPTNHEAGPEHRGESLDFPDLDFGLHFLFLPIKAKFWTIKN